MLYRYSNNTVINLIYKLNNSTALDNSTHVNYVDVLYREEHPYVSNNTTLFLIYDENHIYKFTYNLSLVNDTYANLTFKVYSGFYNATTSSINFSTTPLFEGSWLFDYSTYSYGDLDMYVPLIKDGIILCRVMVFLGPSVSSRYLLIFDVNNDKVYFGEYHYCENPYYSTTFIDSFRVGNTINFACAQSTSYVSGTDFAVYVLSLDLNDSSHSFSSHISSIYEASIDKYYSVFLSSNFMFLGDLPDKKSVYLFSASNETSINDTAKLVEFEAYFIIFDLMNNSFSISNILNYSTVIPSDGFIFGSAYVGSNGAYFMYNYNSNDLYKGSLDGVLVKPISIYVNAGGSENYTTEEYSYTYSIVYNRNATSNSPPEIQYVLIHPSVSSDNYTYINDAYANGTVSIMVEAYDPDNDTITYKLYLDDYLVSYNNEGRFNISTPSLGSHTIKVEVCDPTLCSSETYDIQVLNMSATLDIPSFVYQDSSGNVSTTISVVYHIEPYPATIKIMLDNETLNETTVFGSGNYTVEVSGPLDLGNHSIVAFVVYDGVEVYESSETFKVLSSTSGGTGGGSTGGGGYSSGGGSASGSAPSSTSSGVPVTGLTVSGETTVAYVPTEVLVVIVAIAITFTVAYIYYVRKKQF